MKITSKVHLLIPIALLAGCASLPSGPRVAVMPAPGKPFEVFVQDDRQCRAFAEQSIGMNTTDRAAENLVGSAAVVITWWAHRPRHWNCTSSATASNATSPSHSAKRNKNKSFPRRFSRSLQSQFLSIASTSFLVLQMDLLT